MSVVPKSIVFDLYGTLIRYGVMHHPYRHLLKWARENGRQVGEDDARLLMTTNVNIEEISLYLGINPPKQLVLQLRDLIEDELSNLTLFDDVVPVLTQLQRLGISTAVCSNLAKPYGAVIKKLLGQFDLKLFLSYEVGFIKPENQIYDQIVEENSLRKQEYLFVGDTFVADYEAPLKYGFQARHLMRGEKSVGDTIGSLIDITHILDGVT